jgi:hypothetical protein
MVLSVGPVTIFTCNSVRFSLRSAILSSGLTLKGFVTSPAACSSASLSGCLTPRCSLLKTVPSAQSLIPSAGSGSKPGCSSVGPQSVATVAGKRCAKSACRRVTGSREPRGWLWRASC